MCECRPWVFAAQVRCNSLLGTYCFTDIRDHACALCSSLILLHGLYLCTEWLKNAADRKSRYPECVAREWILLRVFLYTLYTAFRKILRNWCSIFADELIFNNKHNNKLFHHHVVPQNTEERKTAVVMIKIICPFVAPHRHETATETYTTDCKSAWV